MKTRSLLLALALTFSASAPLVAFAQQAPSAPAPAAPGTAHEHGRHHGMMHRLLRGVDLSDQQKTQIKQLIAQYHESHPAGSAPDPQARKQLHEQILGLLTPAQQAQVKANMERTHDRREHHERNDAQPSPQPTP